MDTIVFLGTAAGPALVLAALVFLLDLGLLVKIRPDNERVYSFAFTGTIVACMLVIASYLILTAAFLADSFSFDEVYSYSSSGLPVLYKLGGPWIGSGGSLLFVAALLAAGYALWRIRGFESAGPAAIASWQVLDLFLAFFVLVTLVQDPFRLLPAIPPDGMGLNPLLQTPWVLSHPPIIFLGYVAVFFAFALFLAGLVTGSGGTGESRRRVSLLLAAAWLLLTLGISLGAVWSYRVLGWGGYWAWDPVETASLLPWLALTAYFHWALPGHAKVRDLLLAATFFMVLFATALTRGGFSQSVHAFGESPVAWLLLAFAIVAMLVFFRVRGRVGGPAVRPDPPTPSSIPRYAAAVSLVALLAVCFLGSVAPVAGSLLTGMPYSVKPDFFTVATLPFTLAFVAALVGCNTSVGLKHFGFLVAGAGAAGIALAAAGVPTPYPLANLGLPILFLACAVTGYRWLRSFGTIRAPRYFGRTAIHLGIVVVLTGVFISSAAQTETGPLPAGPGSTIAASGSVISVQDLVVSTGDRTVYGPAVNGPAPEYSALETRVTVSGAGSVSPESIWMYDYLNYGVVSEPLVLSSPERDLYISVHQTSSSYSALVHALAGEKSTPADVTVVIRSVPLVWLVWIGIVLLCIGMSGVILGSLRKPGEMPRDTPAG